MTVYVRIPPERLAGATPLLNLFFGQLIDLNTRERPGIDTTLKYQCLLINDEFGTLGRVSAITSAAARLGGYNLRLLTVVRTLSELDVIYGSEQAKAFAGHHGLQIVFPPKEQREAYAYSAMLADRMRMAVPRSRGGFRLGYLLLGRPQREQDRPLLPRELQELGNDCEIVSLEGCRPILARKIRVDKEPAFQERLLAPPVVPQLDVERHQALVERRRSEICERREAAEEDSLMAFAQDLSGFARGRDRKGDPGV